MFLEKRLLNAIYLLNGENKKTFSTQETLFKKNSLNIYMCFYFGPTKSFLKALSINSGLLLIIEKSVLLIKTKFTIASVETILFWSTNSEWITILGLLDNSKYYIQTIPIPDYLGGYDVYEDLVSDHLPVMLRFSPK